MNKISSDTVTLLEYIKNHDSELSEDDLKSHFGEDGITRYRQLLKSSFVERTNGVWENGDCVYWTIGISLEGRDYLDQLNQEKRKRNNDKMWEIAKIFFVALLAAYFKDFISWMIKVLKLNL